MTEPYFPPGAQVRLVACDMDGTLLDGNGELPPQFWPLLARLEDRGLVFVPASGRQYAALTRIFPADELGFIAENGNYVVLQEEEVFAAVLDRSLVDEVVLRFRGDAGRDAGVVACGKTTAYVERSDRAFLDEAGKYYANLEVVERLDRVEADFVKVSVFDFNSSQTTYDRLVDLSQQSQVVLSSPHWVDLMRPGVTKGTGLRELQRRLGIGPDQTAVFGDFHNDLPMFAEADYTFAVANGHADVRAAARRVIPSNREGGVLDVLATLAE
ncbi:Cof-type HAD-IIB family hydrolase [Scrofimicrobium sp. R131]|uniref:Cof-type HAD-IIB family hydrolase n=1 Tax=Scrofimicrobium appendicitidis TaxID=3079930 RepID=A0AAU7V544_9ACTO